MATQLAATMQQVVHAGTLLACVYMAGARVLAGDMSVGDCSALWGNVDRLFGPMGRVRRAIAGAGAQMGVLQHLHAMLEEGRKGGWESKSTGGSDQSMDGRKKKNDEGGGEGEEAGREQDGTQGALVTLCPGPGTDHWARCPDMDRDGSAARRLRGHVQSMERRRRRGEGGAMEGDGQLGGVVLEVEGARFMHRPGKNQGDSE